MSSLSPETRPGARPRIGLLSLSAIPDDPRVRRQGDLLRQAGWDVIAFGLPGHRSPAPDWPSLAIATDVAGGGRGGRMGRLARRSYEMARLFVDPGYAKTAYWRLNPQYAALHRLARGERCDLWLANDWTALPIASHIAAEQAVPYGYDTHELAVDEHAHSLRWRWVQRPIVAGIERPGIRGAAFASCVSDGIADRLVEVYRLATRPLVIRNTPIYASYPFRPTGPVVEVLYHGVVMPGRGLEACIRSVALWRSEFRLTLRGPASPAYSAELAGLAREAGVGDRVAIVEPVAMTELVERATAFDVGLFALPDHSLQNVYVLPNKLFEYTMAGLALCLSDLPEMTRLVRRHDLGETIAAVTPEAIAEAINRLDRPAIDRFKQNALVAARDLNWEAEGRRLVEACNAAVGRGEAT